jgi:hypothetical protein
MKEVREEREKVDVYGGRIRTRQASKGGRQKLYLVCEPLGLDKGKIFFR